MSKSVPLAVALALSAAANLYLLLARDRPASTAGSPPSGRLVEPESASAVRLKATPADEAARKSALTPTTAAPDAGAASNCDAQLSLARAQVAVLRSELDHHLSLAERFERGNLDASTERRLRPHLERLLNSDGGTLNWKLECRNRICKLHVVESAEGIDWSQLVQRDKDVQRLSRAFQIMAGTQSQNPATGETVAESDAWMQIADEDEMKVVEPLNRLLDSFKASSALADCTNGYQTRGTFDVRLELSESGLSYQFSGSLPPTAAGRCLAERLQAMGAAASLPRTGKPVTAFVHLRSPPAQ